MKIKAFLLVLTAVVAAAAPAVAQDRIEVKTIDGVRHVYNPARPLKGTIKLEVERTRTIDPYEQPEVGMKYFRFVRDGKGGVLLCSGDDAEAHRFGPDNAYLGTLARQGQGPGEFSNAFDAYASPSGFWLFGGQKVAQFDGQAKFVRERKLGNSPDAAIDEGHFFSRPVVWDEKKERLWTLKLVSFDMEGAESSIDLLQSAGMTMIRNPNGSGGYSESWATPKFIYAADPAGKLIYYARNRDYVIQVMNYSQKSRFIIHKAYQNVKAARSDVAKLMAWAVRSDADKWKISAYPEYFAAIMDLFPMPKGYLAAYGITGPAKYEIDVFSPTGEYLYALVPPAGVPMERAQFLPAGFGVVEREGDYFVYREYRIKNLPEIFGK